VQPLALQLSVPGDPKVVYTAQGTTDHNGVIIYSNLPVGTFDVHVKGTHSLQSARAGVSLTANRTADVDMKAMVEGDVDGDNCVTVSDFAIVQGMIGAHKDIPGFNALADLNGDGEVTPADVSLLRSGFDMCGDISADNQVFALSTENAPSLGQTLAPWLNPGALRRDLALSLVPSTNSPRNGEVFTVLVIAEASTQPIDGASFILNYDPSRLLAVDAQGTPAAFVEPGADLPSVYTNWVDAKGGAVGYAAGMLQGAAPQGRLVLATLRFKALVPGATELRFGAMPSGHMQLTNGGINLLTVASSAILTVNP
jgi:hypothetical protein